ncbi:MAG: molybdopterin-dependent oxidoreductase [Gammaproteobacteria bacterium]
MLKPMLREAGVWREASWEEALSAAARGLKAGGSATGTLVHPSCTLEEMHLAARLTRALGSSNIDHRLRTRDFRDAAADPRQPGLGISLSMVESLSGVLVVGSNLRAELPLLAHRLRKAAVRAKAKISFLDSSDREYRFPVAMQIARSPADWAHELAGILAAVREIAGIEPGAAYASLLRGITVTDDQRAAAAALCNGSARAVWLGAMALRHPAAIDLRALAGEIARLSGATLGLLAEGANSAGAWLAGVVPHREAGGVPAQGLGLRDMFETAQRSYLLVGAIEPTADIADAALATRALRSAACVVAVTPYVTDELKEIAHVLLPMASFAETSGSYVNLEGRSQSQTGVSKPPGEARPGWKILRVLGNHLELDGFDYQSSEEVRDELLRIVSTNAGGAVPAALVTHHVPAIAAVAGSAELDLGALDVPMYSIDAVLRRSPALQQTHIAAASRRAGGQG